MADLLDVENAFVSLISATLYPNGTSQPSITGIPAIIYAGWPTASQLDSDLLALSKANPAGRMHVTVFPGKQERNTTRRLRQWRQVISPVITLTLTVSGQQVTVGGMVSVPQNVMLLVNGVAYVYAVQVGDSLSSIAANLAALIPGASSGGGAVWTADSTGRADSGTHTADGSSPGSGSIITLASTANLTAARVGGVGTSAQEIRRQERLIQVIVWGDTPAHRDITAAAIDPVLGNIGFLSFPDQSRGYVQYRGTNVIDVMSKAVLYRRDLNYTVEYPTLQTKQFQQIVATELNISASVDGVPPFVSVATKFS